MNLSPRKQALLRESKRFLARAAPAGARDWVADKPEIKKAVDDAEAFAVSCHDTEAPGAFRAYIGAWFAAFQAYIETKPPSDPTDSLWQDLWHRNAAAKMEPPLWQWDGSAWVCNLSWPDPLAGKAIVFQLRSRGKNDDRPFISAPEMAMIEQAAGEVASRGVAQTVVRLRSVFPGASIYSVNGVELLPGVVR